MLIAICDDSRIDLLLSKTLVIEYFRKHKLSCTVRLYENGASLLDDVHGNTNFDIVFMDPPYGNDYEYDVLKALSHSDIIDRYTIIIIEEALNTPLDYIDECGFETVRVKNYKTNKHIFIKLKESE